MAETESRKQNVEGPAGQDTLAEAQLLHMALRDPLTGLLNRHGFDMELHRIWNCSPGKSFPFGLLVVDVDHFKAVNDACGHAIGDEILKECARLALVSVQDSGVVSRYYGGDELVAILPGADAAETRRVAERMLEDFRAHLFCQGAHDRRITISVGACHMMTRPGCSIEHCLLQADRALYRAKQTGRDKICFVEELEGSTEMEGELHAPISPAGTTDSRHVVLMVDDDPVLCALFRRILSRRQFAVLTAETGTAAMEAMRQARGRIDVVLVDLNLGHENGLELLKTLRGIDESIIGVVVTGQATVDGAVAALQMGAYDFVEKPVAPGHLIAVVERAIKYRHLILENKRYQLHLENRVREKTAALFQALKEVQDSYQFTLEALAAMLDAREQQTGEHSKRVARMALALAREMGATPEEMQTIQTGALLHDIGKIAVPDSILLKPGALTAEEREIMRKHPQTGYDIIRSSPVLQAAAEIVLAHQEHYDGNGYPRGLKGDEICLGARIFSVLDTYDAIRSDRPYSKGRDAKEALEEILRHRGTQFDPAVVDALLRCQAEIEEISSELHLERTSGR